MTNVSRAIPAPYMSAGPVCTAGAAGAGTVGSGAVGAPASTGVGCVAARSWPHAAQKRASDSFSVPQFQLPQDGGVGTAGAAVSASVTLAMALLLGTAILVWLLYRAGRGIGRRAGGNGWVRGLHALGLALAYALVALAVSFAFRWRLSVPDTPFTRQGGTITIQPSPLPAFLWPFAIAAVAGFLGAFRSAPAPAESEARAADRWTRGAVSGGWRMAAIGLVLSYAGFAVNAAVTPGLPREYFRSVVRTDASYGVVNAFLVPNIAGLVLPFAMGSTLGLEGGGSSVTIASLTSFPEGVDLSALDPSAAVGGQIPANVLLSGALPPAYFLYLLVPLAAVLAGGIAAARRVGPRSRAGGAAAGALAGVAFVPLAALIVVLAGVGMRVSLSFAGLATAQTARVGASFWSTILLAAAWGIGGGALGGLIARPAEAPSAPALAGSAEPPPPPPAEAPPTEPTPTTTSPPEPPAE
ncbi:MAG TPA: hypothetical protein VEO00_05605 [Actinomycetota bacterium]|nr:hypothetical protein [Actinomycetota bacterium]